MTKVIKCDCPNVQQDKIWGPGRRVANSTGGGKSKDIKGYRCTSCGKEKTKD